MNLVQKLLFQMLSVKFYNFPIIMCHRLNVYSRGRFNIASDLRVDSHSVRQSKTFC